MNLLVVGLIGSALAGGTHPAPVEVRASVHPAKAGMGDPITYVVQARIDAEHVDASSVRVFADTGPLTQVEPATTTRTAEGGTVVVRVEQRIACLDLACAPNERPRRGQLPPASASARLISGGAFSARAARAVVAVEPRVSNADVRAAPPPFAEQTALRPASDRVRGLPGLLTAVAASLAVVAVVLAVLALRPRPAARSREAALARAVRLLRESALRPVPDRRRAADLVSQVAGSAGERPLAKDAARLAWSARTPEPDAAVALADRAETTTR